MARRCGDGCTRGDKNDKTPPFLRARKFYIYYSHRAQHGTADSIRSAAQITNEMFIA